MYKPSSCEGCPAYGWSGFAPPQGGRNGVLLIGEALGEQEAEAGKAFVGKAGFLLNKLIRHAGFSREDFAVANAVACRPPENKLEGTPLEFAAIGECSRRHLLPFIARERPKVIVPMGNVATYSILGSKQVLTKRGYVWYTPAFYDIPVLPTVHPSFIMRGNGAYGTVFIRDTQRAVEIASAGWKAATTHYWLDPTPERAMRFVEEYESRLASDPQGTLLAYDIETPYDDEEKEEGSLGDDEDVDKSYTILRIGFAFAPHHALSIPWSGPYMAAITRLFSGPGAKVVWNDGFDTPRIRATGVQIGGVVHDGMVAWHVLNSDLPKKLSFVASMLLDDQPAWKHLSQASPAFYNATDADVELRITTRILELLRAEGLFELYERHIVRLFPLLARLSQRGMPIDAARREGFARELAAKQTEALHALVAAVPQTARKVAHVYGWRFEGPDGGQLPILGESTPGGIGLNTDTGDATKDRSEFKRRATIRTVLCCSLCGAERPGKQHFRTLKRPTAKRPQNPCAAGVPEMREVEGIEWYRLAPWRPSKEQMLRYAQVRKHQPPRRRDGDKWKVSFDEDGIRKLILKYPTDPLYPLVLRYRELDKLAGTYIGRPID
jgi:uracil-DNA glycosylase family 4